MRKVFFLLALFAIVSALHAQPTVSELGPGSKSLRAGFLLIPDGYLKIGQGTPNVTLARGGLWLEGKLEVDGAARFDGAVSFSGAQTITGDLTGTATLAGDPNMAANTMRFGTTGILFEGSTADGIETLITVADPTGSDKTITFPDATGTVVTTGDSGTVTATMIANVTRAVNIPLKDFIECTTNGGADINFTDGTDAFPDFINSSTDGLGFVLTFDATGGSPDTAVICSQLMVPPDYVSGGAFVVRATKGSQTATNSEVLNCAGSIDGAALGTAGTVPVNGTASDLYTCTPTLTGLAAGDSLSFELHITSDGTVDDAVSLASVEFTYTASQ